MTLVLTVLWGGSAWAEDVLPAGASGVAINPGIIAGGLHGSEMLLGELGCVHCHRPDAVVAARLHPRKPPNLGDVGSRITPQYLRAFLANPHGEKPGTSMPDVLHALDPQTKARTVEDLVHYLASMSRREELTGIEADAYHLELGKRLFHSIGCVACHAPQDVPPVAPGKPDATADAVRKLRLEQSGRQEAGSVALPKLAYKTTVEELADFLLDPLKVRPSGRMPALNLKPAEARAIAMYLLRGQLTAEEAPEPKLIEGLKYTYHEGSFNSISKVLSSPVKHRGSVSRFTHAPRKRENSIGFIFQGLLLVPRAGKYRFHATSDDGTILWIGEKEIVNNDGDHGSTTKRAVVTLAKGRHPIRVAYYNNGGPHALKVEWEGPGMSRREIGGASVAHLGQAMRPLGGEVFKVDAARAERGKSAFASLGCASCHRLANGRKEIVSSVKAKNLPWMRTQAGCLADLPPGNVPRFDLSESQRTALRVVIQGLRRSDAQSVKLSAEERVARSLAAHNCYACHERGKIGGPGPKRSDYFLPSIQADLGDEARFPPHLDRVGAKLRPGWMQQVLTSSGSTRSYIATRMPQFGPSNIGTLASDLAAVDLPVDAEKASPVLSTLQRHGRTLVGKRGFECITCHSYGKYDSLGMPAADLTQMTRRVRKSWFRSFLFDPQSEKPGTRMPQFFPGGKSVRESILDGDSEKQIEAIWAYLSKGPSSKLPSGLKKVGQELIPEDEALIYRHFIEGVGSRAIGVGYPEEIHLAFDANEVRIALIWRGSFIDASRHRNGRGSGWERPLGEDVLALVDGAPFAVLETKDAPWPKASGKAAGYRMGGYRLDKLRRPSFFYTFPGARVEDYPVAVEKGRDSYFERRLSVTAEDAIDGLWFRAASGTVVSDPDGSFRVDGKLSMRFELGEGLAPLVRDSAGRQELLIPVVFKDGVASFVEVIGW